MKLLASITKEWLLLLRDKGGLGILFLMPMVLVIVMAIVQDAPFRDYQEQKIPVLFVNQDSGEISQAIMHAIQEGKTFVVVDSLNGMPIDSAQLAKSINSGDYQIGIIVKKGLGDELKQIVDAQVEGMLAGLMPTDEPTKVEKPNLEPYITLLLDPTTKHTFRSSIRSAIKQFLSELEGRMIIDGLSDRLAEMTGKRPEVDLSSNGIVQLREKTATGKIVATDVANNSTQHNVPAWTVFAMFFIVIPLAGNMVRERTAGTITRLRTMPTSMFHFYAGKLLSYSAVGLLQALLMISVGFWLMPSIGLAKLDLGSGFFPLLYVAVVAGFAATSYGLLVGTIFKTLHQAAIFGTVSVVIMAALGGIWVPLYIMSDTMIFVGHLSPMNWAMEAFNGVFLRGEAMSEIIFGSIKLWTFGVVCFGAALVVERKLH
ncbi:MAG: ABC transporter permease [Flavobacteriales bacterium]|nr:ABC transporter permease [Flavobacteriales bacterium]